jgi:hypothetical protein
MERAWSVSLPIGVLELELGMSLKGERSFHI